MRIKSIASASVLAVVAALSSTASAATDFSGNYHCNAFDLDLKETAGQCDGALTMGANKMPATAVITDDHLAGTFKSQGKEFPFTAVLSGDELKFTTGSTTYTLTRPPTAVNPLAAAQNPLAAAQPAKALATPGAVAASSAPTEIKVLATTETGKTLFIEKPSDRSAQAALQSAIADLTKLFGARPAVSGAFADSQQDTRGGAIFTVNSNGRSLRGVVLCGGGANGEVVTVTYAAANANPTEWATLTAALPRQEKIQTIKFPDDSGSVDLPDGWTTPNNTVMGGVVVNGPSDEKVSLTQSFEVVTPDSQAVQMQRQLEMNARQWGMQPPPPLRLLVAPYSSPTEALQNLIPQISRFSESNGGPAVALDKIISSQDAPASLPNGKASLIDYTWIRTTNGEAVKMRTMTQMECYSIAPGTWAVFFSALAAPESSYDRNLATMWAIARSFKVNDAVVAEKTNQQIQASNERFAAFQESMKEKNDAFDRFEQSMRARSESQSKCNADFDEVIRGYRTVEDTNTGERTSVDLGKVDDVVNKLNEGDPGRYKQIPLRDE
jgi:hypothetical protein